MKKTLLTAAVAVAMVVPFAAQAGDELNLGEISIIGVGGPEADANESEARNEYTNSNNVTSVGSYSPVLNNSVNDVNSDNLVEIEGDGIVVHANQADQAIATSDLDSTVSGNRLYLNTAWADTDNAQANNGSGGAAEFKAENKIMDSFTAASGVTVVSQNLGHASVIEQSVVVQSNFNLN